MWVAVFQIKLELVCVVSFQSHFYCFFLFKMIFKSLPLPPPFFFNWKFPFLPPHWAHRGNQEAYCLRWVFLVNAAVAAGSFTVSDALDAGYNSLSSIQAPFFSLAASFWSKIDLAMPTERALSNILQLHELHLLKYFWKWPWS